MIEKGQIINGRYEVIKLIGEGGMANVYLAYDKILDRNVAIKVLRGDLAEDEKFVRRFQREAVSASELTHPNIVGIYDVGEEDGKYFIVMEYVEGKTLKSLIKKRGALTLPEVQDIMLQLTSAIAKAHESYIIHRDIKPQNVIIQEDGRVKVMDFGIAARLNSNNLTQTDSVMGTVYYLPPEQANGGQPNIKSDIYSLGILMYELVVGKVPFKGDSQVEVAIKHIKEPLPKLAENNEDIPQSLENIILKACAKNPKNRYDSVEQMHKDLKTMLDEDRFDEPKVVYEYPENDLEEEVTKTRSERNKNKNDKNEKKLDKKVKILGIIASILALIILFIFVIYPNFIVGRTVKVPDVSGLSAATAQTKIEEEGLKIRKVKEKYDDDVKKNKAIETDPEAGKTVKRGTKIILYVSKGSKKITIEDYTGQNYYEVKAKLEDKGITVETDTKEVAEDSNTKENVILEQDVEAGEKLTKGDVITLTIPNIYVVYPDFAKENYSQVDVKNFCKKNGITLEVKYQEDPDNSDGKIIDQNMVAGTKVTEGSTLTITVVKNEPVTTQEKDTASEE